jgi:hypothetical protein
MRVKNEMGDGDCMIISRLKTLKECRITTTEVSRLGGLE